MTYNYIMTSSKFLSFLSLWPFLDNLYIRVLQILIAKGELSGKFEEYFGFKRRVVPLHFVKVMSSDLNIQKMERLKGEKGISLL